MTILLELRSVSLSHRGHPVLSQVSFAARAGQVLTIVGPNGAGKSSLIKVALGLIPAQAGQVWRRPGLVVGYVPQRLTQETSLPVDVARFLSMVQAVPDSGAVLAVLDQVGVGHITRRALTDLSGGELQRVLLARALLKNPDLLVLDEPVGGVDMAGQVELYDLIGQTARNQGKGVVMVSHDLHVVMAATDEVLCLNGHVCCSGHPEAVAVHPDYLALFGPRAASSLAIYTHVHDHVHGADGHVHQPGKCDHRGCSHG